MSTDFPSTILHQTSRLFLDEQVPRIMGNIEIPTMSWAKSLAECFV
ncbi:MAG: hypothetical protein QXM43_00810 [Desulfurococcaceae archaeon]